MDFYINHFNINVLDLEKSLAFYARYFNLHEVRRHNAADGSFIIVWISDANKHVTIELTWLKAQTRPYDLGDNEFHIAFVTNEYQQAYEMHQAAGIICYENLNMGIYFVSDPDGYWLEVVPAKR